MNTESSPSVIADKLEGKCGKCKEKIVFAIEPGKYIHPDKSIACPHCQKEINVRVTLGLKRRTPEEIDALVDDTLMTDAQLSEWATNQMFKYAPEGTKAVVIDNDGKIQEQTKEEVIQHHRDSVQDGRRDDHLRGLPPGDESPGRVLGGETGSVGATDEPADAEDQDEEGCRPDGDC